MKAEDDKDQGSRWQRRQQRRERARRRMKKHGASLARVYAAAVRKRLKRNPGC